MGGETPKPVKIKVCTGSHCKEFKAKKIAKRLREYINEQGQAERLIVKTSDCLGLCKKGPVVTVPCQKREYTEVKLKEVRKIAEEAHSCGNK